MATVSVRSVLDMLDNSTFTALSSSLNGAGDTLQWNYSSDYVIIFQGIFTEVGVDDYTGVVTALGVYSGTPAPSGVPLAATVTNVLFDYTDVKTAIESGNLHDILLSALDGSDSVVGGNDDDVLAGHDGADEIEGLNGDDLIEGGAGNDQLEGWFGRDTVYGQGGDDIILDQWTDGRDPVAFQVFRLYKATLDRAPDVAGHDQWTNSIKSGMPVQQAVSGFVNSAEFQAKYGATSNGEFVTLLYNNVLDRDPDAGGYAGWVNALNGGMSREAVVLGFSDSLEFRQNTEQAFLPYSTVARAGDFTDDVFRLYRATLDREPDAGGLLTWTAQLASGAAKSSVVAGFVGSAEFQAKYGATSNGEFVTLLYNNVLGRDPDAGGYTGWVNALNNGMSREAVVLGFSDSAEFVMNTDPDVFAYARSVAMNDHNDTLNGGADDDSLVGSVGADVFEFIQGESGSDLVGDFEAWDWVRFQGFSYTDVSHVTAHMTQLDDGVEFSDQGQTILFWGTEIGDFTSDNFIFA